MLTQEWITMEIITRAATNNVSAHRGHNSSLNDPSTSLHKKEKARKSQDCKKKRMSFINKGTCTKSFFILLYDNPLLSSDNPIYNMIISNFCLGGKITSIPKGAKSSYTIFGTLLQHQFQLVKASYINLFAMMIRWILKYSIWWALPWWTTGGCFLSLLQLS